MFTISSSLFFVSIDADGCPPPSRRQWAWAGPRWGTETHFSLFVSPSLDIIISFLHRFALFFLCMLFSWSTSSHSGCDMKKVSFFRERSNAPDFINEINDKDRGSKGLSHIQKVKTKITKQNQALGSAYLWREWRVSEAILSSISAPVISLSFASPFWSPTQYLIQ